MRIDPLVFIGCDSAFAEADSVLFGAPFDGTTSFRPGTRFGPGDMRMNSYGLETYSLYQNKDLMDARISDDGDLLLPFGSPTRVLSEIEAHTEELLRAGKRPFMIGGEHLVTLGALRAMVRHFPDLYVIQFDAHADLRDNYIGETLSHGTVMRRAWELLGDGRIYQFGIRSGEREEFAFASEHTHLTPFTLKGAEEAAQAIGKAPVYISVDLDVLDPSLMPGTGTPEAGGILFPELLEGLLAFKDARVVGCDVNELSPHYDASGASTAVACKVLREMLLAYGSCALEI